MRDILTFCIVTKSWLLTLALTLVLTLTLIWGLLLGLWCNLFWWLWLAQRDTKAENNDSCGQAPSKFVDEFIGALYAT